VTNDDEFIDAAPTDYLEPGETATVEVDGVPVTLANAAGTWCAFEST
jgi:3-phenylpropionate/trans-cinnamate dioxygenase ferredoxin subunit